MATTSRLGRKAHLDGEGRTRGAWERELERLHDLAAWTDSVALSEKYTARADEIAALLAGGQPADDQPADDEATLRRRVSALHRGLQDGGDPTEFQATVAKLRKRKGTK